MTGSSPCGTGTNPAIGKGRGGGGGGGGGPLASLTGVSVSMTVLRVLALVAVGARLVSAQAARHEFTAVHMGVPMRIVLYAESEGAAREAARAAYARVAELDEMMSDYRPGSAVRRLSGRPRDWQPVSPDLARVLSRAQDVSRWSGGAFDVTVGPLVRLWRESRRSGRSPEAGALSRARSRTGWRMLEVDTARSAVWLWADSMQLDLGGIAKGYTLGEALKVLRGRGLGAALVEAGGDLVVGDAPPGAAGWSVALPAGADSSAREAAGSLANVAVATSGGTEQYVEIAGVRYSHVVDPRTGLGVVGPHLVTVIARDGALADALATALSVLGPERGPALVERLSAGVERVVWTLAPARDEGDWPGALAHRGVPR